MGEPTWSTLREAVSVVASPPQLKRTVAIALIVGSTFFAMNQLGPIAAGRADAIVWLKVALTYLTPLLVSNFGVLSATRQRVPRTAPPEGARETTPRRLTPEATNEPKVRV